MNEHLYTITKSITEDNYLYEQVESCGQRGVRCRIYLSEEEMCNNCFNDYNWYWYWCIYWNERKY